MALSSVTEDNRWTGVQPKLLRSVAANKCEIMLTPRGTGLYHRFP